MTEKGFLYAKVMSGLNIIPFGQRKAETSAAVAHLAKARCQEMGTTFRDFISKQILETIEECTLIFQNILFFMIT